jgi:hypothetical protein
MSVPERKTHEAPANHRGLPLDGLWWIPARIATYVNGKWKTIHYNQYNTKRFNTLSIAVSPIGIEGDCHFIGWDIDGPGEDVRKLLQVLPKGCVPLVSLSGKKGYHCWLFFDRPLAVQTACEFGNAVKEKAGGVQCEVFPTNERSKALKWLGSVHPETGVKEIFIHVDDLSSEYDTAAVLEGLESGIWRTPCEVIELFVKESSGNPQGNPDVKQKLVSEAEGTRPYPSLSQIDGKLIPDGTSLAAIPEIALGLAWLAGRRVNQIGRVFKCILPGHEERKPSAAFYKTGDGRIMYHDFHQRDGEEWLTLGEVYRAVVTGEVRKLRPVDSSRWLCRLALRLGFETEMAAAVRAKLSVLEDVFKGVFPFPALFEGHIGNICPVDCKSKVKGRNKRLCRGTELNKVWRVFCDEAVISAMAGFEEVKLSERWLAKRAEVSLDRANRSINLYCTLGLIEKVHESGGMRGDRYRSCQPDPEEVRRRYFALFPDGRVNLRQFKRQLVMDRLGEQLAKAVFRRF